MITEWTTPFVNAKDEYISWLATQGHPGYEELLKKALEIVVRDGGPFVYGQSPDPDRIHSIDDGHYQGTLVFVIGADGYQPYEYWYTKVSYGSCAGCDALQDAIGYGETANYEALYLLALHMMQGVRKMDGEG